MAQKVTFFIIIIIIINLFGNLFLTKSFFLNFTCPIQAELLQTRPFVFTILREKKLFFIHVVGAGGLHFTSLMMRRKMSIIVLQTKPLPTFFK